MTGYRSRAFADADGECIKCGMSNDKHNEVNGRNLDVHHMDGDTSNNELDNLKVLCRTCHHNVHFGKEGYTDLHDKLPERKQWEESDADNWKTLRVPADDYLDAKQQKEANGRTWGQQLVRPDDDETGDGVDEEALAERIVDSIGANAGGAQVDDSEIAREVARKLDYAELSNQVADEVVGRLR
jgi:hypothetical protein